MAEDAPRPGGDPETRFEAWVRTTARTFAYPPMPTRRAKRPRPSQAKWVWAVVAVLALVAVAAGVAQFIQVGGIRVWLVSPTPPPTLTPLPITTVLDLQGITTLAEAQKKAGFTLLLPTYPTDLGQPAHVYYQEPGAPMVVLVWLNADGSVRLSLHIIGPNSDIAPPLGQEFEKYSLTKFGYELIRITNVNQTDAFWVEGERQLIARDGTLKSIRLVDEPSLLWEEFGLTFRLEGAFTLSEMVRIAESLR